MDKKQKNNIKIRFESFKILDFSHNEPAIENLNLAKTDFQMNFRTGFKADKKESTVSVRLKVEIQLKHTELIPVGNADVEFTFKAIGLDKLFIDEQEISIPAEFLTTLISLSYSTTRGIILAKGAGTILEKAIIPIIDPHKLLPKELLEKTKI